jgi:hypothetical protein
MILKIGTFLESGVFWLNLIKFNNKYYIVDDEGNIWASAKTQGWACRKGYNALERLKRIYEKQLALF